MSSSAPLVVDKIHEVVGLFPRCSQSAGVCPVDEKSQFQALARSQTARVLLAKAHR